MVDVTNNVFGFELFQKLYHDDIHKKEDVIILFMHWYLTKSGFRCIGIGDDVSSDDKINILRCCSSLCMSLNVNYNFIYFHYSYTLKASFVMFFDITKILT